MTHGGMEQKEVTVKVALNGTVTNKAIVSQIV